MSSQVAEVECGETNLGSSLFKGVINVPSSVPHCGNQSCSHPLTGGCCRIEMKMGYITPNGNETGIALYMNVLCAGEKTRSN
jgi:hypothetical protein